MIPILSVFIAGSILSPLLLVLGRELWLLSSMEADIDRYEQAPENATFVRKWIFGWQWKMQRDLMRSAINLLSDRLVTGFYRLAGLLFLAGFIAIWMAFLFFLISFFN
jgi:hypothetical protein